jgi:hypothetical protein
MEKGTRHGFKNIGTTPAAVLEIFVKEGSATAELNVEDVVLAALSKQ